MPKEVSEATAETAQVVEEKPSEETQVAAPEPSEAVEPVQEPAPEESAEERDKRILQEYRESEEYKGDLQSEADKRALKLRQEFESRETVQRQAQERDQRLAEARQQREQETQVYSQLLELRQTKPEEFVKALDNPAYRGIWDRGGRIAPSTEEIDNARSDGFIQLYGTVYRTVMSKPEMTNLSNEEAASIAGEKFQGVPDAHAAYLDALTDLWATKKAQAIVAKERGGIEEAAGKKATEKLQAKYREAGVVPEEIEGGIPTGVLTVQRFDAMTTAERKKVTPEQHEAMVRREYERRGMI